MRPPSTGWVIVVQQSAKRAERRVYSKHGATTFPWGSEGVYVDRPMHSRRVVKAASPAHKPRPRSKPHGWSRSFANRRRLRRFAIDPLHRAPKGLASFWTRARQAALVVVAVGWRLRRRLRLGETGWAVGAAAMALVSYLIAPVESPPRYGLDHEFDAGSAEFLATIAGATGVPFTHGNRIDILNNGDEFYPVDARRDREGPTARSRSRPTSTGRERSGARSRRRWPPRRAGRRQGQDPARCHRIGSTIGDGDPARPSSRADVSSPGTTRSTGTRSAGSTTARTASR